MIDRFQFAELLSQWSNGSTSEDELYREILARSAVQATQVTLDLDRAQRCGNPEVVYGPGKDPAVVVDVFRKQIEAGQRPFLTRGNAEQFERLSQFLPQVTIDIESRTAGIFPDASSPKAGLVAVVSAGTSDLPIALEAAATARWMGCDVDTIIDVGVAGPQRLLRSVTRLQQADAVCVVAGMEGALPSVVAGWLSVPVIAVPTSVGYGTHLHGMTPLLAMLTSCAANVAVVNIDAGFKGGYLAGMIARSTATSELPVSSTPDRPLGE